MWFWWFHSERLRHIEQGLRALHNQGEEIMSALTDLQDKMVAVAVAIGEEKTEVQGMLNDLKARIQALQDQIAAGTPATEADLVALSAKADEIIGQVRGISEPTV